MNRLLVLLLGVEWFQKEVLGGGGGVRRSHARLDEGANLGVEADDCFDSTLAFIRVLDCLRVSAFAAVSSLVHI